MIVFYTVATEKSIAIAADKLCLTQPTVSYHLKEMEKNSGVKLFNIKKQRVYLTRAGQDIYEYTKEIWEQLNNIDRYFDLLKQKPIRIGVTPLLHKQVTSGLSKACKLYPNVKIEILIENSTEIVQQVSDTNIDVGIVVGTDYETDKIKTYRISDREKLVFVSSPDIPIAKKDKVDWSDLQGLAIICGQQGSLLNSLVAEKFLKAGLLTPPHIMVNSLSTDVLKIFVKEGQAIGLWHYKEVEDEVLAGQLKILPLVEEITIAIDFVYNESNQFSKTIIKDFVKYIKLEFKDYSKLDPV
jgi:DNA-binding transcriptional LysR family regulator